MLERFAQRLHLAIGPTALIGALLVIFMVTASSSAAATIDGSGAAVYRLAVSGNGFQEYTIASTGVYDSAGTPVQCTKETTFQAKWTLTDIWNDPAVRGQGPAWDFDLPTPTLAIAVQTDDAGSFTETIAQSGTCPADPGAGSGCGTHNWPFGVLFELPLTSASQLKAFAPPSSQGQPCKYDADLGANTYTAAPAVGSSSKLLRWCNALVTECSFPEAPRSIVVHGGTGSTDTWQLRIEACKESPQLSLTGDRGWEGLSGEFQERLQHMVEILEGQDACVQFSSGYRTPEKQVQLYKEWHDITDKHNSADKTPTEICEALAAAGLAQPPGGKELHVPTQWPTHHCNEWSGKIGYKADGKAEGGPAPPGSSLHEVGEAADFKVLFPPEWKPDVARFRDASHAVDLCGPKAGPTKSDQVHVEMPYKKGKETEPSCHFD